jgi:hypothetical protein
MEASFMRRSTAAAGSVAWFVAVGGTFGCLLPYLLNDWHFHRPLPYWAVARVAGVVLIGAGLVPLVQSFIEFTKADGTPVPVASPPRQAYRRAVRAWLPRVHPWTPSTPGSPSTPGGQAGPTRSRGG